MPELEPLEADVLSLLRAEKPIADLEPTAKASILASIEAQIGLPPGGAGGAGGAGGTGGAGGAASGGLAGARAIAAIVATFAIGVATGVVVAPSVTPPPATVQSATLSATARAGPSASASALLPPDLPAVSVGSLPSALPSSARVTRLESPEVPVPSARGLGAERGLLDVARGALARGEPGEALAAVDRHSHDYPDGALFEEREALAIKALVALGRRDEARARARSFEQRFPNGLLLRAVKGAVGQP